MNQQLAERPPHSHEPQNSEISVHTLSPASYVTLGKLDKPMHKNEGMLLDDFGVHFPPF